MDNQGYYKLYGIMNFFDIVPDFVRPIFEKDNDYFFQTFNESTQEIEFAKVKESAIQHITPLSLLCVSGNYFLQDKSYSVGLFAFQTSKRSVVICDSEGMVNFLSLYKTDDEVLKKILNDLLKKIKILGG